MTGRVVGGEADFPGFPVVAGHPCTSDRGLRGSARGLLLNSLAPASWRAYAAGQSRYRVFCARFGLPLVPASVVTLVFFLADLERSGVGAATARQRLAAVRHLHIQCGASFAAGDDPLVSAAVRGFQQRGAGQTRTPRRGVTIDQLRAVKTGLGTQVRSYFEQRSIWAACTTAFYGGLRAGDYLQTEFGRGLRRSDLAFASDGSECVRRVID